MIHLSTTARLSITAAASLALAGSGLHDALAQSPAPGSPLNVGARWVCRAPDAQHPQNATITGEAGATPAHCEAINVAMSVPAGMIVIGTVRAREPNATDTAMLEAPRMQTGVSPAQLNAQWAAFVERVLQVPSFGP